MLVAENCAAWTRHRRHGAARRLALDRAGAARARIRCRMKRNSTLI